MLGELVDDVEEQGVVKDTDSFIYNHTLSLLYDASSPSWPHPASAIPSFHACAATTTTPQFSAFQSVHLKPVMVPEHRLVGCKPHFLNK